VGKSFDAALAIETVVRCTQAIAEPLENCSGFREIGQKDLFCAEQAGLKLGVRTSALTGAPRVGCPPCPHIGREVIASPLGRGEFG